MPYALCFTSRSPDRAMLTSEIALYHISLLSLSYSLQACTSSVAKLPVGLVQACTVRASLVLYVAVVVDEQIGGFGGMIRG